jgi:hypothetical protein
MVQRSGPPWRGKFRYYTILEGKDVGKKGLEGSVLRLSKKSAKVALDTLVKILTNLKMNLGDVDERL